MNGSVTLRDLEQERKLRQYLRDVQAIHEQHAEQEKPSDAEMLSRYEVVLRRALKDLSDGDIDLARSQIETVVNHMAERGR